jgi:hypothetical protein
MTQIAQHIGAAASHIQAQAAAPVVTITETDAIATVLHAFNGATPTAAQVASMSTVMTQGMLEVGYVAAATHMSAGEVVTEISQLAIYGSSTTWGNSAAPVVSTAQATIDMAGFGHSITLPDNLASIAIAALQNDIGAHNQTVTSLNNSFGAVTNGMVNVAVAAMVDPGMTTAEAADQFIGQTIYGGTDAYSNAAAHVPNVLNDATAISLVGNTVGFHLF